MKYAALLYNSTEEWEHWEGLTPEEAKASREQEIPKWVALFEWTGKRWTAGFELGERSDVKVVRVRDGETTVTDGPYAETKEVIGGLALLECEDLDEAIEIAARVPLAVRGSVEVRPIVPH